MMISNDFLKRWREKYRWPFCLSRTASEEKIQYLEDLVTNNVLKNGLWSAKDVLLEIVNWKTGGTQVLRFCIKNSDNTVLSSVTNVQQILRKNPNNVSQCIEIFSRLNGVAIPVASAFLRFLDPIEHKYGIIDKNIARLLNIKGITDFGFDERGYLVLSPKNIDEYQKYHIWLQQETKEIDESHFAFTDIYGNEQRFAAVDIDMALFAFSFTNRRNLEAALRYETKGLFPEVSEWLKQYQEDMSSWSTEEIESFGSDYYEGRISVKCPNCGAFYYPDYGDEWSRCPFCGKKFEDD